MHQVAASIWNEIARSGRIKDLKMKSLMELDEEELAEKLEKQADMLKKTGYATAVVQAYQSVMPLLVEGPAIAAWAQEQQRPELREAFPQVETVYEATQSVVTKYDLGGEEIASLMDLISKTLKPHDD
jgi:hypothetical protein